MLDFGPKLIGLIIMAIIVVVLIYRGIKYYRKKRVQRVTDEDISKYAIEIHNRS